MRRIAVNIFLVLLVIYVVPFLIYGSLSMVWDLKPPGGASPAGFLVSVLVSKVGTAITFVLIFYLSRGALAGHWLLYAFLWWLMFVIGEAGQAIVPNYTWKEAVAGVISETVYFPLSAYITNAFLKTPS